jgi:hypothetical protein
VVKEVHLPSALPEAWVAAQKDRYLDERHFTTLVAGEPTNVFKPDGSPLLLFRPGVIAADVCDRALSGLRKVPARPNDHRNYLVSNAIGFYPCRKTPFTRDQLWDWVDCLPFIRACNGVFRHELSRQYSVQRKTAVQRTPRRFVIPFTAFTTVTVNHWDADHDGRTRVHKDDGDLREGFGVISVFSTGDYSGGYLVFPQYRVAVDMRTTDVLLCDVHEWHANTPIVGADGWQRIATVLYYRTAMQQCGTASA